MRDFLSQLQTMKESKFEFNYNVFESIEELPEDLRWLLNEARQMKCNLGSHF